MVRKSFKFLLSFLSLNLFLPLILTSCQNNSNTETLDSFFLALEKHDAIGHTDKEHAIGITVSSSEFDNKDIEAINKKMQEKIKKQISNIQGFF